MNKEQLQKIIEGSKQQLNELKNIKYDNDRLDKTIGKLGDLFKEFGEASEELISNNDTLQIGIVGQVKAGKSSFLNSLFFDGDHILPKASTPMTAGLTIIEYAEENAFEVEYFSSKDWVWFEEREAFYKQKENEIRKQNPDAPESVILHKIQDEINDTDRSAHEMMSACTAKAKGKIGKGNDIQKFSGLRDLQNVLEKYVGAKGEYTSVVKSLHIKMKDDRLKGLRIVDTPGVNDPVQSREYRTRVFLQSCHGVFLLSASTDFMGSGDVHFLNTLIGGSGIGSVVLLASKFDSVLQDIGAQREMTGEGEEDLVENVEIQMRKFRDRFKQLQDTIDEKLRGGRIKIDRTSGIGYSIAKKATSDWDAVEKQVVQQMKRFYPDYFSTDKDIRETFEGLANITDIREKYLDEVFMKNKESIIQEKISGFFVEKKKNITLAINDSLNYFVGNEKQVRETNIDNLEKQKKQQGELFKSLEDTFNKIFDKFIGALSLTIKSISNKIHYDNIYEIPTESVEQNVDYCGRTLFFIPTTKTCRATFDRVNVTALEKELVDALERYAKSWNEEWNKLFEENCEKIRQNLVKVITEKEQQMQTKNFDDKIFRDSVDVALDKLQNDKELEIDRIIRDYKSLISKQVCNNQYRPYGTGETDLDDIPQLLAGQLYDHNLELKDTCREIENGICEDVRKEAEKNLQHAVGIIAKMKPKFSEELKEQADKECKKLEKAIADKNRSLEKVQGIVSCLEELSKLYA